MDIEKLYDIYLQHPNICTDSRKVTIGVLFFALKGESFDANEFALQALSDGAAWAVVDDHKLKRRKRCIYVEDVLTALQELAQYHRSRLKVPVIGVTGSNGKTTTKELLNAVLSQKFKTFSTKGNLNNHIGVPLSLLSIDYSFEIAVIEMGANHQGEIALLTSIAQPNYGIVTNVGKAHLEGFGGFNGVKKAKKELYDYLAANDGTVFYNSDNEYLKDMSQEVIKRIVYGTEGDIFVLGKIVSADPTVNIAYRLKGQQMWNAVCSKLIGGYNFENILAAVTVGCYFGISHEKIKDGIESYIPSNNRSQIVKTERNTVICDYYNANPTSMQAAINNLSNIDLDRKMVILGDMLELGEYSKEEHQKIVSGLAAKGIDKAILIGENFMECRQNTSYYFFKTTKEAVDYLQLHGVSSYTILLKGSRGMALENLMEVL